MTDPAERAQAARILLSQPGCVLLPSAWDAGVARLLTAMGFPALETTSAGLAYSFGRPDGLGGVSLEETLANARAILAATHLPVFADLENGFEDVAETVRLAADIGLSGGSIEDSAGRMDPPLYPEPEAVDRVRAAVAAARATPHGFHVTARCEGLQRGCLDLPGVIARLRAYAGAGADAVYAPGLTRIEDVAELCAAMPVPVTVLTGGTGAFSMGELAAAGVRRASLGSAMPRAALGGILEAAGEMQKLGTCSFAGRLPSFASTQALMAGKGL
ncbi:isocitrate lyase/PEP mutase family protein [Roseococcus sp. YIM B11640]|uniref:isocitrate lyase/PEP mutase family protein n=1 Tax=Roseococcus sp. YIM B11640 TaxID=3133973 RepID=UPI003C7E2597